MIVVNKNIDTKSEHLLVKLFGCDKNIFQNKNEM